MEKIKLYNRDGADLWLEKVREIEPNIFECKLICNEKHKYCLQYTRYIYENGINSDIISIDPSGGPFISLGDEFGNCKIIKINSIKSIWISERNNNN
jgi:hypothetical protein